MTPFAPRMMTALAGLTVAGLAIAACGAPDATDAPTEVSAPPAQPPVAVMAASDDAGAEPAPAEAEASDHDHDHDHDHDADDTAGHDHDHAHGDAHDHDHGHDHDHDHAGGAPHVHGAGDMAVVVEGGTVTLTLQSALANFGVSESEPQTDEARAAHESLKAALADAGALVSFPDAAGCTLGTSDIDFVFRDHGDLVAEYGFDCANPDALNQVTADLFTPYPAFETLNVVVLKGAVQVATSLEPGDNTLAF